ncbi:MAG TPA: glutamine-hydrolyzing GMP synthase, partial [Phycisphaerae bacterium]|nr:glutamine-hydrolyzing GMP synthase [Phycisphaerae bacterium]
MTPQTIAILDFGSQYVQLIARRVRENHVRSLIFAPGVGPDELRQHNVMGIILSGGPASTYEKTAPRPHAALFEMDVPILGICYGMQVACQSLGGRVETSSHREFGRTKLTVTGSDPLIAHLPRETSVWMSHGDRVTDFGSDFVVLGATKNCPNAIVRHKARRLFGVQFHPEVTHTPEGSQLLRNFLFEICEARGDWTAGHIVEDLVERIRGQVSGDAQVICGLSGGVDSSVTAALLNRAIPGRVSPIFVDNGLLRGNERDRVEAIFRGHFKMDLHVVDAEARFLERLGGVTDPQEKRRRIGHAFIDVFKEEAKQIPNAHYLAQGTTYPDVIESGHSASGAATGTAANIKLHHNVGGLPAELGFELVEPLRELFKDEVRAIGELLGLPEEMVWRHPFPGPGLAVRIIGEVTRARCELLREADAIILEEIVTAGWYRKIAQAFGVLLPVSSVGVMGDGRAYADQNIIAIRFVESTDFMTADWVHIDPAVLATISTRITNEVRGVNRVVYDVTS